MVDFCSMPDNWSYFVPIKAKSEVPWHTNSYKYIKMPYLSDGHSTENVKEDERTVGIVLAWQVAMWNTLDQGNGSKRQSGHYTAIKSATTHTDVRKKNHSF